MREGITKTQNFPLGVHYEDGVLWHDSKPLGGNPSSVGGPSAANTSKKSTKTKSLSRRLAYLQTSGGYLDYITYYRGILESEFDDLRVSLKNCHHNWIKEVNGEKTRYRGIGCGEIRYCPLCGQYKQLGLAQDAYEKMMLAIEALKVRFGIDLKTYGFSLVLTIPKEYSKQIDDALFNEYSQWKEKISQLFSSASKLIRSYFGVGTGVVMSCDYTGESEPTNPHYHINAYVFPARRVDGTWYPIKHWQDKDELKHFRFEWSVLVNRIFNINTQDDSKLNYLRTPGQLRHWLQYLYKHQLNDLWAGWRSYSDNTLNYSYKWRTRWNESRHKYDFEVRYKQISASDLKLAFERLEAIPKHFKRVRWFGIFSDSTSGKTFAGLGLERVEADSEPSDKWVQADTYLQLIHFTKSGIILRDRNTGDEFEVLEEFIEYSPSGIHGSKRTRWREPCSSLVSYMAE